jgi:hypothetical protein
MGLATSGVCTPMRNPQGFSTKSYSKPGMTHLQLCKSTLSPAFLLPGAQPPALPVPGTLNPTPIQLPKSTDLPLLDLDATGLPLLQIRPHWNGHLSECHPEGWLTRGLGHPQKLQTMRKFMVLAAPEALPHWPPGLVTGMLPPSWLQQCEQTSQLEHILVTEIIVGWHCSNNDLNHIILTITFNTIVAFVISLVTLLMSSPMP